MGSRSEPVPEFVDTGTAPEYFIEAIGMREHLPGGIVRSYVCSKRGGLLIPQYIYIAHIKVLASMAAETVKFCARHGALH